MAMKLKNAFIHKGYKLFIDSPTNQQFVVLKNDKMEQLAEKVSFSFWEKTDDEHTVVRFATSWATKEEDVDALISLL
jgi:threonine aldolase